MAAPAFSCPQCGAQLAGDVKFCGRCGRTILPGAAAPAGLEALTGRVVAGRYRVVAKLGAGGMGTVFRAEQVAVKRPIALKVLDPAMTANPELVRRFQAEAEVVARLSHPNTVTLFDFGQDDAGLLYIAMELVPGKSLRDVIAREAPLGPYRAVDVAEQIASSLADAHSHGIVHRDLKPDNVILSERAGRRDFARVLDFGIAKLFDDGAHTPAPAMTRAGQILGTPQYMSPEQVTGRTVDGRTDIYALGVMLYEMLTGRPPFTGDSLIALLSAHLHDPPPPLPPQLGVPMPLERLLFACLAKEAAQRPPDMVTVATTLADLRTLLDPGPRRKSSAIGAMPPLPTPLPGAQMTPPPMPMPVSTPGPSSQPAFTPPPLPMPGAQRVPTPMPVASPQWAVNTPAPALPAPRKTAAVWPWLVLALLVVAGGGAAAFFGLRGQDGGDTPEPSPGPAPGPGPGPSTPTAPTGPPTTFTSSRYGYTLLLPGGLSMNEDAASGAALATGTYDGNVVSIGVHPVSGWADADSREEQIRQAMAGAQIIDKRERRIRDTQLVSIVYDMSGSRFETVFYPGETALAVTFASTTAYFDETAALRDSLFRDRFQPGGY
jgi:serine/threonine-protein kinase